MSEGFEEGFEAEWRKRFPRFDDAIDMIVGLAPKMSSLENEEGYQSFKTLYL